MRKIAVIASLALALMVVPCFADFAIQERASQGSVPVLQQGYDTNNEAGIDLKRGLIGYWPFEERAWDGTMAEVKDYSAFSNATAYTQRLYSVDFNDASWTGTASVNNSTQIEDTSGAAVQPKQMTLSTTINGHWQVKAWIKKETGSPTNFPCLTILMTGGTTRNYGAVLNTVTGKIVDASGGNWTTPESTYSRLINLDGTDTWEVTVVASDSFSNNTISQAIYPAWNSDASSAFNATATGTVDVLKSEMQSVPISFNHGNASNGAFINTAGKVGHAAEFIIASTSDIFIGDASSDLSLPTGGSIAAWIYPYGYGGGGGGRIMTSPGNKWNIFISSPGNLTLQVSGGTSAASTGGMYPPDTWTHMVVTFDGTATNFYANCSSANKATPDNASLPTSGSSNMYIGSRNGDGTRNWDGAIDELAIYNRVLTQTEACDLYNGGRGRFIQ